MSSSGEKRSAALALTSGASSAAGAAASAAGSSVDRSESSKKARLDTSTAAAAGERPPRTLPYAARVRSNVVHRFACSHSCCGHAAYARRRSCDHHLNHPHAACTPLCSSHLPGVGSLSLSTTSQLYASLLMSVCSRWLAARRSSRPPLILCLSRSFAGPPLVRRVRLLPLRSRRRPPLQAPVRPSLPLPPLLPPPPLLPESVRPCRPSRRRSRQSRSHRSPRSRLVCAPPAPRCPSLATTPVVPPLPSTGVATAV